MRANYPKVCLSGGAILVALLLLGANEISAQTINITVKATSTVLPDGQTVPMWGYACNDAGASGATCAAANPNAGGNWSPVVITTPTGSSLTVNLTNSLPSGVPTSLVVVGQLGGGLGTGYTTTASPVHPVQGSTWPVAGDSTGSTFTPPAQAPRVQSFATEVSSGSKALTWNGLNPGTYLIESGTHPSIQAPMGLYGVLVVTGAPSTTTPGVAYPNVNYNAELPLILSEIDPAQNNAVNQAVNTTGFSESATQTLSNSLTDTVASISLQSGGSNYSSSPTVTITGGGGSGAKASATVSAGKITSITVTNPGQSYTSIPLVTISDASGSSASAIATLSVPPSQSCNGAAACYPPVVNYTPLYYLINGVSLDRNNLGSSLFAANSGGSTSPTVTGTVLVRLVNAGLRMHVPSIVGATTGTSSGFSLIAEDGNPLPGIPRVQSEVFMAAGKTYDVMINAPAPKVNANTSVTPPPALPIFDRQLSLSTNNRRDGGMQAYIGVNGAIAPAAATSAAALDDSYIVPPGTPLAVTDPGKGVISNDIGVYGVQIKTAPANGTVTLKADGTFTYTPGSAFTSDSFVYMANGNPAITATVSLGACANSCIGAAPVTGSGGYTSNIASRFQVGAPGVFAFSRDPQGHPLIGAKVITTTNGSVTLNNDGSFTAVPATVPSGAAPATLTFTYTVTNSQNTTSDVANAGTITVTFLGASGLRVNVLDAPLGQVGTSGVAINDYRWIIEEDRTFQNDPSDPPLSSAGTSNTNLGTNFHTSYMPVVAAGCVGTLACEYGQTVLDAKSGSHKNAVCDVGDGICRTDAQQQVPVDPSQVHLDPKRHYYVSILPGDAGNSFTNGGGAPVPTLADPSVNRPFDITADCGAYTGPAGNWTPGTGQCGHGMGGAQISPTQISNKSVNVLLQETPFQPSKISVFVYEDDFPLNGENDAGGGVDVLAPNEPGLGGFEIRLWDDAGGTGDATGQMTYDMFNMPLSNSLAGTKDPTHPANDACPITKASDGIVGRIVTCPKYESDGVTLSPLAGQAVIANMMPGRYGIQATPSADRFGKGEEWLQTNTLDGQKAHDSFIKVGGPAYFQEFGPAGFHVSIGFANPAIINGRLYGPNKKNGVCSGGDGNLTGSNCINTVQGTVREMRQSHPPDQRLYGTADNTALSFTQCYVSLGDADGEDFAFAKCDQNGKFVLNNIPDGDWRITVFDQWNDQIVDGLSTPVRLTGGTGYDFDKFGGLAVQQWHTNFATSTFFDKNGTGVRTDDEQGLALVPTNIRFRDGSYSNFNSTDLNGYAQFNEIFPLFNWYVIEADTTRYKQTGVHVVYDGGGIAATSGIAQNLAGTVEGSHLPNSLRFPGSVYCGDADCTSETAAGGIKKGPSISSSTPSTGRIDPPWVTTEGWQGFIGQYEFLEFGKTPYAEHENGGIHGEVIYASTRPFDDPSLLIHTSWTPDVPNVTVNLYQESTAADGTTSLKLVDTTKTTSWDDWAQGFRKDANGNLLQDANGNYIPNMNCPGQADASTDPFFFTLKDSPFYLDQYDALYNGGTQHSLPSDSRYKCYDGLHNFNQVQPAPYDGMYTFPSVTNRDPNTGLPTLTKKADSTGKTVFVGSNCDPSVCIANPTGDGTVMLPSGKYVVEMITPPGYELVKEEDKNILIGDNYIAPVVQEFGGLGNIFILPDQASVLYAYNVNNGQNPTNALGRTTYPTSEGDTGSIETFWPCVGQARIVPDYISLFPGSAEVAPFAGATRNLCDRKEVTLTDQSGALAKFWVFSSTHVAAHFTGFILDDLSSEFDPYSPQFGEKFAVPNLPVSIKDFAGNEVERVYADQWGTYNGLNYSTWEVNPPNPTGYAPTMMVACMNDPGNGATPDPYFNPSYSQFCYEIPYMPGQTQYMDTPVVPTAAFAEGYNPPDCSYPAATPAIASAIGNDASPSTGSGKGPWVNGSGTGHTLTLTALGKTQVPNPAYTGPQATSAPYNQKFLTRNYSFGNQCTVLGSGCTAVSSVAIGGVNAPITSWADTSITVTVPTTVPSCAANGDPLQRNGTGSAKYAAQCGQVVVTAGSGQKSIDAVTLTIGGKAPSYVNGENSTNNAIQTAIDNATPGDLILVGPGVYNEMVLMWKPVRLQGVGAASTTINANTHPSGKMDPWRRQVNCLFGLSTNGSLLNAGNVYDPTGQYSCSKSMQGAVDPLPLEGIVGWDTTLNGNLAELLQEPSLMGAYEGAGITVLGKGENMSIDSSATGAAGSEGDFPAGSRVLTASNADCNAFASNFWCNPSRIDGFTITNSSQGGGGIFTHAWNHNLEIANDRIYGNAGTLSGGINVGQGESPDAVLGAGGVELAFMFEDNVRVHNNSITANTSYGDELFSASPSAAGGVTFCTGADNYHFNYNWVCGNLSTGDGGGLVHEGFIYNGDISHNWILFNQSNNISIPTNGGGIAVLGAAPDGNTPTGTECGNTVSDADCAPGLSDGTGPGLVIDSNVIMGNTAESGSGGGIRLQTINGTEVTRLPLFPGLWNHISVTNNIIANNVAGWDGGGISLQDALNVDIINNTIASNDTTASAGVLFNTIGAPNASTPPPGCDPSTNPTCAGTQVVQSVPQPAGLVSMENTGNLKSGMPTVVICPLGHTSALLSADCKRVSYPLLANNLFWQNRTFHIAVGGPDSGMKNQQNLVSLLPTLNQTTTGQCVSDTGNYWDIGFRGDTGPTNHSVKECGLAGTAACVLSPTYSVLTDTTGYPSSNRSANPNVASQYCNGSRVPPELGGTSNPFGYQVPPGISDATVPNPVFNLTPAATVDEGNNWINLAYGPLSLQNPTLASGTLLAANGTANGNYGLTANSTSAIGAISSSATVNYGEAPAVDIFGTNRKANGSVDIGAVEYLAPNVAIASISPSSLVFGNVVNGSTSTSQTLTLTNTGGASLTGVALTFSSPRYSRPAGTAGGTCTTALAAGANCTINVVFAPTASGPVNATLTIAGSVTIGGSPVALSGTGVPPGTVSITPNPLTITLPTGTGSSTGVVTLKNTSTTSPVTVSGVAVTGGTVLTWFFNAVLGADTCTGSVLQPGASCTVGVRFTNVASARGVNRSGTITFTDNATGSPQAGTLTGHAN